MFKKNLFLLILIPIITKTSEPPKEIAKWIKEHIRADEPLANAHLAIPAPTTYRFTGGRFGDHIQINNPTEHRRFHRPGINPSTGTWESPFFRSRLKEKIPMIIDLEPFLPGGIVPYEIPIRYQIPISKDGEILWPTKDMWAEIEERQMREDYLEQQKDYFARLESAKKTAASSGAQKRWSPQTIEKLHALLAAAVFKDRFDELLQTAQNGLTDTNNEDVIL